MYSEIFHEKQYCPSRERYDDMKYRKVGKSGLSLPMISLGMYHYFGNIDGYDQMKQIVRSAFEYGIFHMDNADCYGPPNGESERNLGRIIREDFRPYRDELIIATKGGFDSFLGPNGEGGSKKHLTAAINNSLRNLGLEYVDIYYHHVEDTTTPLEETAETLASFVKQGKALHIGISNYSDESADKLLTLLEKNGVAPLIGQYHYNMLHKNIESTTLPIMEKHKMGVAAYVPLAQGFLTDKYLGGNVPVIPRKDSIDFALPDSFSEDIIKNLNLLNDIAKGRGQTLAQMSIAWCLRNEIISTVLVGCNDPALFPSNVEAVKNINFTTDELAEIQRITSLPGMDVLCR